MTLPQISVIASANGREADGRAVVLSFSRSGATDAALSVDYQLLGTAKAGSDYSGSSSGSISFAAGSATASLSLPVLADGALIDPGETIIARIISSDSYTIAPGKQFATATITAEGMVVSTRPGWSVGEVRNDYAFAALKGDGTVVAWGYTSYGGTAPTGLGGVTQIFSTPFAFAALKSDGTVDAWGFSAYGGSAPSGLSGVIKIFSNEVAFAALKSDGTVVAWGPDSFGGTAPTGLGGVTQIFSTPIAFAALKSDGSVVAWGDSDTGGTAPAGLVGVTQIFSTAGAFAALKSDGTVVAWGDTSFGGTAPVGLGGVTHIFSNSAAFAALKSDGSVVAWGDTSLGGTAPAGLGGVTQIFSTGSAFAALKGDGSVVAWGDSSNGGTAPAGLGGVTQIFSTGRAFAALKGDGTVVTWGDSDTGGTAPTGLGGVTQIFSTGRAFAALKADGSVVAWGDSSNGGTAPEGLSGVVGFANPSTDDQFTILPNTIGAPSTPIAIEAAGLIKLSSDGQGVYSVQSTLTSQLPADSVNTPKEQLGGGLIRQKYRDVGYGFESQSAFGSQSGDLLSVLYTGRLIDGTIFDSNTAPGRSEFAFTLGAGSVIQGFDLGLVGASLGDIYHLEIPSTLGYGSTATGSIPANSTLIFDVEIRGIKRGSSQLTYQNEIGSLTDSFTPKKEGISVHSGMLGSEWRMLAAERVNGANQVLWRNTLTNKLLVWSFDSSWSWISSSALIDPSSGMGKEVESQFGVDINGDGTIFVYKTGTTSSLADDMTGSSADEFFAPLGVGATGLDRIFLGGGKNQVQLQASSGANLYSSSKLDDFLAVEGFDASSDQLLLSPAQAYGSFLANVGSEPGLAIYEDRNSDKNYNNDDEVLVWLKGLTAMPAISFGAAAFAVSGTAQVGQVLTVAKTADDPDGNGPFTYQWQSSLDGTTWSTIGTNASYTLSAAEQGKQVRVRVSYTDAQSFSESLTVAAGTVPALNDGAATFVVSGTAQVGQVLTVAKTADDPDGNGAFTYQWQSSTDGSTWGTIGTDSATYTISSSEQAKQIRVQASYTDAQGFSESLTVAAGTVAAVNDGAATFAVSGTAQVGQVLTIDQTGDDPDGNGSITYQWQSSTDGSTWGTIGANAATYTLSAAEQGKQVRVRASYTDGQNFSESLTVAAGSVAVVNDGAATFAVSGSAQVGQVLTVAKTADDPDGNGPFAYQWQSSTDGTTWGTIGVNAATYTLSAAEQGKQVRVLVSYTDGQSFSESLTVVAASVAAVNDGVATFAVSGAAQIGQVFAVAKTADDPDGNGAFSYQWQSSTDGSSWANIGSNSPTYTIVSTDEGKQIRVRISYTDNQAFTEVITVAAGAIGVVNDGPGAFSVFGGGGGTAVYSVGQRLLVEQIALDPDGTGQRRYQWQSSTNGNTWSNIGIDNEFYTLTNAEKAKQIRVLVSYTDGQGFSESIDVGGGTVPAYDTRDVAYTSSTGQAMSTRLTTASGNFDGDVVIVRLETAPIYQEQNENLSIGKTGIDFTLNLDPARISNTANLSVDLVPLLDGINTTQKRLAYFVYSPPVGVAAPIATPFTYDPVIKAGARFYDLDGNGSADTAELQFVDGGYGDKDGVKNGVVVDPSTAGAVEMNAIFTASANSLTVGDPTDTTSPASLLVRASLSARSSTVNQIGYVALNASESLSLSYDLVKERGTLLFGTLTSSDVPDLSSMRFQRDINLINGQKLMFFEVVDNTLEAMLKSGRLDSSFRILDITKLTDSSATAGKGGSILNLGLRTDVSGLGELISSQMGEAPIFDFTSLAGQALTGDVVIAREASYDSVIGFYKLERSDGAVRDSLTNTLIMPGELGYSAAALRIDNLFNGFGILNTSNRVTKTANLDNFLDAGLLAPYARVANTGETYFSFAAANSDGLSHFRVLGSGVLGLEDIKGGGDRDFDDLIVGFNFKLSTVTLA